MRLHAFVFGVSVTLVLVPLLVTQKRYLWVAASMSSAGCVRSRVIVPPPVEAMSNF